MLALLGLATITTFLALIVFTRTPVIAALILVPIMAAVAGGFTEVGPMAIEGLRVVAPVAALLMFAVLYFGLMIDTGLFEPIVARLTAAVKSDPVRLCLGSALLPMLVALDGDGATTFLISITALLPIHRRLGIRPVILPTIVGLSAGVMNMLPWGGPTARAMAALDAGVEDIFTPMIPAMLGGIAWVFFAAWVLGRLEAKRLYQLPEGDRVDHTAMVPHPDSQAGPEPPSRWFVINLAITALLLALLFRDLYASILPLPAMPAPLLFMVAFAIALPLNRRSLTEQQEQLARHAPNAVLVTSMILAAGIFTGILNGTGMIGAMGSTLANAVPGPVFPFIGPILGIAGMPLSLVFTPDAFYFGILPIFAHAAEAAGQDPHVVGRAAILGQMTTGFPLSPLTASTFILIGLSQVTLREVQRTMFPWALGTTIVMTIIGTMTEAI